LFCPSFELQFLIALFSLVCFAKNNGKTDKGQKGKQKTKFKGRTKTMAKQTKDKRPIRNCNSKDGQYNGKPDKGQKGNQKLYFKGRTIQWQNRQGTKEQSLSVLPLFLSVL
jgi:hypothetical protein